MDMITVSAKTLDEAITKALIELQTTSVHLYYEVVEKGSTGLLGIFGVKPCVIRARVKSEAEEREEERVKAEKAAAEMAAAEKAEADRVKKEQEAKALKAKELKASQEKEARSQEKEKKASEKKNQDKKPQDKKYQDEKKPYEARKSEPRAEKQPVKADPEVVQRKAKEFLEQVFKAMEIEVVIETSYDAGEGELLVTMSGADMGILIGKRGQTLDSLQYLVSLVVNKETEGYLRVKLDTENYRERRKETLETLAKNIAYKVKRTKRPVSLEPMNPYERRIIHSALQNDKYIVTRSEGEDPFRHVVVSLKRENRENHENHKK